MNEFIREMKEFGIEVKEIEPETEGDSYIELILPNGRRFSIRGSETYWGYNTWYKCVEIEEEK